MSGSGVAMADAPLPGSLQAEAVSAASRMKIARVSEMTRLSAQNIGVVELYMSLPSEDATVPDIALGTLKKGP